jgi:hypothetical protein
MGVVLAVFGLPTAALTAIVMLVVAEPEAPADLEIEYAVWPVRDRSCLGVLERLPDGTAAIDFKLEPPPGATRSRVVAPSTQGLTVMRADQLVGRRVFVRGGGQIDLVTGVTYSSLNEDNFLSLRDSISQPVTSTCLADDPGR